MKKLIHGLGFACLAVGVYATTAWAEALVEVTDAGVEPGLVQSWSGDGREVELTLRSDADPVQVVRAIEGAVDRVRAKVRAGKVVVRGKSVEELMPLLANIEVEGDEALAELAQLQMGQEDFGSGSSLRAKKKKRVDRAFVDRTKVAFARVLEVEPLEFPRVKLTLQILASPKGALRKKAFKGKKIVVLPVLDTKDDALDLSSETTRMNLGAYYLEPKDRVRIRLDGQTEDGTWLAGAVAR
ncbi:MAG TPA: hypothetical protein RMG48_22555 [Myxococcales bacterium LLY-WYZ-16_1]|nr:hypothetical protein [Myxococcales bacterium LLY-WYZ-16_1]